MRIAVTIGRNIGTEPMSPGRWANFCWAVKDQMYLSPEPTVTLHTGEWEGVAEESCTIVGEAPGLRFERWAHIARAFSQDAIAVLVPGLSHWSLIRADGTIGEGWAEEGSGLYDAINGREAT